VFPFGGLMFGIGNNIAPFNTVLNTNSSQIPVTRQINPRQQEAIKKIYMIMMIILLVLSLIL
jgi:hypothetical protein